MIVPYSAETNLALVGRAFTATPFLRGTASAFVEVVAAHPESTTSRVRR